MGDRMTPSLVRESAAAVVVGAVPNDVAVIYHLPDAVHVPCVFVAWADPWLLPTTMCQWESKLEIIAVAARIEPGGHLTVLEDLIAALLPAFRSSREFAVIDATAPYPIEIGGNTYLAASINLKSDLEE
jgi:hypothetical protein